MRLQRGLRVSALLIAVLALVDPGLSVVGADRQTVAILSPFEDHAALASRISTALEGNFEVSERPVLAPAAYVVIGSDLPEGWRPPADAVVFAVTPETSTAELRVLRLTAPETLTVDSVAPVDVELLVGGSGDREVTVTLVADDAPVQTATSRITGEEVLAKTSLTFVPSKAGVVHVRVEADVAGRRMAVADTAVTVTSRVWRVLIHDGRPTYSTTFIRRSLEADPRFAVTTRVATSRVSAIQSRTAPVSLGGAGALDEFDLVMIGAAETLGAAEGAALERYLRARHGAVVLLPEGPGGDVLPRLTGEGAWREDRRLEPVAVAAAAESWAAREFIWPAAMPPLAAPLATLAEVGAGQPVAPVWQMPVGSGRLVVSSAADGWRSRAGEALGFSAFWRSTVAAMANATPPMVRVDVAERLLEPGQATTVAVEILSGDGPTAGIRGASGQVMPLSLWPSETGVPEPASAWAGGFRAPDTPGQYRIEVSSSTGARGVVEFRVIDADASGGDSLRRLSAQDGLASAAALAHRGAVVAAAEIDSLSDRISATVTPSLSRQAWYPMRSVWWLVPFTLCASGEWWLRRRGGQR